MHATRRSEGAAFERAAEAFLQRAGLLTVARNWSCRFGEIDLIMQDRATLVFVEVRKRDSLQFGGAAASIGRQKQSRLERAITLYLAELPATPPCRVDAVLFDGRGNPEWIKDIVMSSHG